MADHLEDIEAIFTYAIDTIDFDHLLEQTRDKINALVAEKAFQGFLSGMMAFAEMSKIDSLKREIIKDYIDKVYTKAPPEKHGRILQQGEAFFAQLFPQGYAQNGILSPADMEQVRDHVREDEKPSFERFKEQTTVGILLKLLQGPLYDKFSHESKDHIASLGALYGEYLNNDYFLILEDKVEFEVPVADKDTLYYESASLLDALSMCRRVYGEGRLTVLSGGEAAKAGVFGVVGKSLARLLELAQSQEVGDATEEFIHNLVVGVFLMYAQAHSTVLTPEESKKTMNIAAFYRKMSDRYVRKNKSEVR